MRSLGTCSRLVNVQVIGRAAGDEAGATWEKSTPPVSASRVTFTRSPTPFRQVTSTRLHCAAFGSSLTFQGPKYPGCPNARGVRPAMRGPVSAMTNCEKPGMKALYPEVTTPASPKAIGVRFLSSKEFHATKPSA